METDSCQIKQRPCVLPILPQIANLPILQLLSLFVTILCWSVPSFLFYGFQKCNRSRMRQRAFGFGIGHLS